MNVSAFPFGTWHIKNCLNLLMHQFRYGASSFGLEERSSVSVFLLCILDMSSSSLSSPLNIAWANRTMDGWNCICGERLSVLAGPDTQQFAAHCRGRKHRAGTAPPLKPKRQLAVTQFFSAAPPPVAEEVPPPIAVGSSLAASTATRNAKRLETRNVATCEPKRLRHRNGHLVT